jgi:hypothetical protein
MEAFKKTIRRIAIQSSNTTGLPEGIYLKECDSDYYKNTCAPMFIAALFTIAKVWKQLNCHTTNEWIMKTWYLYTMEFYLATKKNETLSFTSKWMEL